MRRASTQTDRYSSVAIAFHWSIAALVLTNLWIGLIGGSMAVHKAIGITVLVLTIGRVAWRLGHRPPPLPASVPSWQRGLAYLTHWALYALLLLMPLTGWLMVSGAEVRRPLNWFGLFPIPYLPVGPVIGDAAHGGHELLGYVMLALVALHVAAALYHQLIRRDATLARILPG